MGIVKRIALGLCLAGVVCTAGAVNWVKVYAGERLIVYIDPDRIRTDGVGHKLVWTFGDYSQKPIMSGNMTATAMIERYAIDCRLDRYLVLSAQLFDPQGNLLGSPDLTGYPGPAPAKTGHGVTLKL
ncbi:surface-adhesin E family protein [Burkholderia gladioli]|uniref:surface-adhesin E family protein n=1 Tax=Burkholderia gladioli TaxID=28095 RepID=UPI0016415B62|nr:surface-adhesin E family protein [Burkholderia gladioli]